MNNLSRVYEYLRYRAEYEEVLFDLDEAFLQEAFETGIRDLFGIVIGEDGLPISDSQQPQEGFLQEWLSKSTN